MVNRKVNTGTWYCKLFWHYRISFIIQTSKQDQTKPCIMGSPDDWINMKPEVNVLGHSTNVFNKEGTKQLK